jgi:hypothetical protein
MALGFRAGPKLGELLTAAQNMQLEGQIQTREEALAWLQTPEAKLMMEKD